MKKAAQLVQKTHLEINLYSFFAPFFFCTSGWWKGFILLCVK